MSSPLDSFLHDRGDGHRDNAVMEQNRRRQQHPRTRPVYTIDDFNGRSCAGPVSAVFTRDGTEGPRDHLGQGTQPVYQLWRRPTDYIQARRRDIKRRRLLQTGEDFEMETLPPTLSGALKFALSEADSSFLTNDGILPYMESTRRPRVSDEDSYAMNGALGTQISTPSEDPQNTTSGTFGAQQPAAVPAAVPVSEGLPRVAHEPLTAQSTTRREEVATPEDSV
jgi:hypothetical protein